MANTICAETRRTFPFFRDSIHRINNRSFFHLCTFLFSVLCKQFVGFPKNKKKHAELRSIEDKSGLENFQCFPGWADRLSAKCRYLDIKRCSVHIYISIALKAKASLTFQREDRKHYCKEAFLFPSSVWPESHAHRWWILRLRFATRKRVG